jgi:hypothetical protein
MGFDRIGDSMKRGASRLGHSVAGLPAMASRGGGGIGAGPATVGHAPPGWFPTVLPRALDRRRRAARIQSRPGPASGTVWRLERKHSDTARLRRPDLPRRWATPPRRWTSVSVPPRPGRAVSPTGSRRTKGSSRPPTSTSTGRPRWRRTNATSTRSRPGRRPGGRPPGRPRRALVGSPEPLSSTAARRSSSGSAWLRPPLALSGLGAVALAGGAAAAGGVGGAVYAARRARQSHLVRRTTAVQSAQMDALRSHLAARQIERRGESTKLGIRGSRADSSRVSGSTGTGMDGQQNRRTASPGGVEDDKALLGGVLGSDQKNRP